MFLALARARLALPRATAAVVGGSWPLAACCCRAMSIWKSRQVQEWVQRRTSEEPTRWLPWKQEDGRRRSPELSLRRRALLAKQAIRDGEIRLEPTVMVPPPKFKGHRRERERPAALATIAEKMEEMPRLLREYREARRERRAKLKEANRWK